jgi:hypothetical protein
LSVAVPAGQVAFAQEVPFAYLWQPPAPSHLPFVPHVAAPWSAQNVLEVGVAPAITGAQPPALPATLQAWHGPQLALVQQTLSTQLPVVHWLPAPQDAPGPPLG